MRTAPVANFLDRINELDFGRIFPFFIFAFAVLVAKLLVIAIYGNATPYWDQWDAEAANLYKPMLEGTLSWKDLIAPHNEHRIFTTRVLAVLLFELGGAVWNPILQMQVNAVIHVLALTTVLILTTREASSNQRNYALIFSALIFVIPFGLENTLAGFQSQFYILLLLSFIFLELVSKGRITGVRWWLTLVIGILSFYTLASGLITVIAGSLVLIFRRLVLKQNTDIPSLAIIVLLIFALIGISQTPVLPYHADLKAKNLTQFLGSVGSLLSWPFSNLLIGIFITNVPIFVFIYRALTLTDFRIKINVFLLGLIFWLGGQVLTLAYGRAIGTLSSRYLDLIAIGMIANFIALIEIYKYEKDQLKKRILTTYWFVWILMILSGFVLALNIIKSDLDFKRTSGLEQEKNVKLYLCDRNMSHLQNKPFLYVPYPDSNRLAGLLNDITIQKILPGNIYGPNSKNLIGADGEPFCDPGNLTTPFVLIGWDKATSMQDVSLNALKYTDWSGKDYFKSEFSDFQVIGSVEHSENETGVLTVKVRRGERILFRTGPRVAGQFILIKSNDANKFYTDLPRSMEWSVLEFAQPQLPETFEVSFVDAGTKWGEWMAVGLRK